MKLFWSLLLLSLLLVSSIIIAPTLCVAENSEIDLLLKKLSQAKEDTTRINTLLELAHKTTWSDKNLLKIMPNRLLIYLRQ